MATTTYPVAWRIGAGEISTGCLESAPAHLELRAGADGPAVSISADEVTGVRIGRQVDERVRGEPALVVERSSCPPLHIAPVLGVGIVHELCDRIGAWVAGRRRADGPLSVLIAGGGVAGAEAALALRALAEERVSITILSPDPRLRYRPLGVVEPFGGTVETYDFAELARDCGAELLLDGLGAVDADAREAATLRGERLRYDVLVVAVGARAAATIPGALSFRGPSGRAAFAGVLEDIGAGEVHSVAFAVPDGTAWALPLYELALLTADRVREQAGADVRLTVVTSEDVPLAVFGGEASAALAGLLEEAGIELRVRTRALRALAGVVELEAGLRLDADRVVSAPCLVGPGVPGLPADARGFLPTDAYGHVGDRVDVFAAGDATTFPVKQGGLAAQQAAVVATGIAARAGAPVHVAPFEPVLRGLVLTGGRPLYLRAEPPAVGAPAEASDDALWWPPAKIASRYLAPYLAGKTEPGALHST